MNIVIFNHLLGLDDDAEGKSKGETCGGVLSLVQKIPHRTPQFPAKIRRIMVDKT
jgi:hypothetical protein